MSNSERFLANGNGDEETPLLGNRKPPSQSSVVKFRKCLTQEVTRDWADLVLLSCYVVTGLLDSASTQVWGAFVSMQTGESLIKRLQHQHSSNSDIQVTPSMSDLDSPRLSRPRR